MPYWTPIYKRSWAFSRFLSDHTLNNQFYWHSILTRVLACKFSTQLKPDDIVMNSTHIANQPEPHRFAYKFIDWKNSISDHENWTRLNVLLASTAYLERYVYEISLLAVSSDPGVLIGKSRSVNGVHFLKNNIAIKGLNTVKNFTKGTWHTRYKYLNTYFNFHKNLTEDQINKLNEIQIIRNRIAHRFGRGFITDISHFTRKLEPLDRLSEKRLKEYMKLIDNVATTLDENIYKNHISNFEILLFWHNWDKTEKHKSWAGWSVAEKLRYGLCKYCKDPQMPVEKLEPILKYYNEA